MSQWHTDQGAPTGPWYPAPPVPRPEAESRDRQMSAWALGLSILPLVLTLVPAVVLAIIVLSRARSGRPHGQRRAVAALAVSSAWVLLASVIVVAGLVDLMVTERNADGEITETDEIFILDLRAGDCFVDPNEATRVFNVRAVPCSGPHAAEIYGAFEITGDEYPGDASVARTAEAGCAERFSGFVGRSYEDSELQILYFTPEQPTWQLYDDHEVLCAVTTVDGELVTGTLRNARR